MNPRPFPGALSSPRRSYARIRGRCSYCTECCADFCRAAAEESNATDAFDCTASNVTGCSESPIGWQDSVGRTCADYKIQDLCTFSGDYGLNWKYNPPRTFADFAMHGRSAVQAR